MNRYKQLINFGEENPIQFTLHTKANAIMHWHPYVELLYITQGDTVITVKNSTYSLKEDDLLLINPYTIHSFQSTNCVVASFALHINRFDKNAVAQIPLRFDCNSTHSNDSKRFYTLKRLLAMLVKANANPDSYTHVLNKSLSYAVLHELCLNFGIEQHIGDSSNSQNVSHIEEILDYINKHYHENISLKDLANITYLTVPYLSRMFKNFIGINFSEYLTTLRLNYAVNDLLGTDHNIEFIAQKNGFPNSRSFVSSFKKEYHLLPSAYRKEKAAQAAGSYIKAPVLSNQTFLEQHSYLGKLAGYLDEAAPTPSLNRTHQKEVSVAEINTALKGYPLRHTFKQSTCISKAKHILYSENQKMLRQLQEDIGFLYIKFHGLLDDDMMVYSESADGTPEISFTYIDMVFDFLLSINLRPIIQLSFMPKALALTPERTTFYRESVISLPYNVNNWNHLISQLIQHLEIRYGKSEVELWPFYLWNQPDSPSSIFGFEDRYAFFEFYQSTYRTVKKCNPKINFGAPSVMNRTLTGGTWYPEYMDYCKAHDCVPDFINFHFYPLKTEIDPTPELHLNTQLTMEKSEDSFKDTIYQIRKNARLHHWDTARLFLTEWSSTVSHRDLLNDTAFKAAYLVKNILDNYDRLDSFGYWSVSDLLEEIQISRNLFHGGLGLFTYNGIKKSHYYAFVLLSRLGDSMIGKGDSYFITKKPDSFQILLYNYQHYSDLYAAGELFDMTFTNRYTAFPKTQDKLFNIPFTGLKDGNWLITETIINQKYGSSFDKWIECGAQPLETEADVEYLKSISVPHVIKRTTRVSDGNLLIQARLMPHEVRLITFKPWI